MAESTGGTVTRRPGPSDSIVFEQQSAQGNVAAFIARDSTGVTVGYFRSLGEGQRAVDNVFGRRLRWTRQDLRGDIENWVGVIP